MKQSQQTSSFVWTVPKPTMSLALLNYVRLSRTLCKFLGSSLLKSRPGVQHHITHIYICTDLYKIHQTILYRIIRDYIH